MKKKSLLKLCSTNNSIALPKPETQDLGTGFNTKYYKYIFFPVLLIILGSFICFKTKAGLKVKSSQIHSRLKFENNAILGLHCLSLRLKSMYIRARTEGLRRKKFKKIAYFSLYTHTLLTLQK